MPRLSFTSGFVVRRQTLLTRSVCGRLPAAPLVGVLPETIRALLAVVQAGPTYAASRREQVRFWRFKCLTHHPNTRCALHPAWPS